MDRMETIDMAVVADRIRPLAQQASEGLRTTSDSVRQTSDSLRQTLDHARDVIAERIEDVDLPAFDLEPGAALAMAAQSLPFLRSRARARAGRSPLQWLLIAIAVAGVTVLATFVLSALAERLIAQRKPSALVARSAPDPVSPVAIPISDSAAPSTGDEVHDLDVDADLDTSEVQERAVEAG
jgi:hypothetical protein